MEGRLGKIRKEKALLEQPFIKDTSKTVAEHIKSVVASLGENIQVMPDRVMAAVCPFALGVSAFTHASILWCPSTAPVQASCSFLDAQKWLLAGRSAVLCATTLARASRRRPKILQMKLPSRLACHLECIMLQLLMHFCLMPHIRLTFYINCESST